MNRTITPNQKDGLTEVINIGVGKAAGYLSEMVGARVDLTVPEVCLLPPAKIRDHVPELESDEISCVYLTFSGPLVGKAVFALPTPDALRLASAVTGEAVGSPELQVLLTDALSETGNILINGVMGSISDVLKTQAAFAVPGFARGKINDVMKLFAVTKNEVVIFIKASFAIHQHEIGGNIMLLFQVESFDTLIAAIDKLYVEG